LRRGALAPYDTGARRFNVYVQFNLGSTKLKGQELHSRKFREYCSHFIDEDLNTVVINFLIELMRLQDKIYHKQKDAPVNMFKTKRKFFVGLREVSKFLKLKKIKMLIIASDIEPVKGTDGLNDVMNNVLEEARQQSVFTVFTMSRFPLGRILKKKVPVSCIGIRDYMGCEAFVKDLEIMVGAKTVEYNTKLLAIRGDEEVVESS